MDAKLSAIRIYGSSDQYGPQPRMDPNAGPLETHDFPSQGDSFSVWLGAVPEPIQEICRVRDAIASTFLNIGFGVAGGTDFDSAVEAQLRVEPRHDFTKHQWYVTIVLERAITLAAENSTSRHYGWTDPRGFADADEILRREAPPAFELAVTAIASIIGPSFFEHPAIPDRFVVTTAGRPPMIYPRMSGSLDLRVGKPIDSLDLGSLQGRLDQLGERGGVWQPWLKKVAHWYSAMLETSDPWKRFQWAYLGLEVLTTSSSRCFASQRSLRWRREGKGASPSKTPSWRNSPGRKGGFRSAGGLRWSPAT